MSENIRKMIDKVKNFKSFINEDTNKVPNELYHYTSEVSFDRIMDSNRIVPSEKYGNRLSTTSDEDYHKKQHGLHRGNLAVRLTLDTDKLTEDGYNFIPFDHRTRQNKIGDEFEYVVSKPIENIKKYIKYITIFENPPELGYIDKVNTDYANKYYNLT